MIVSERKKRVTSSRDVAEYLKSEFQKLTDEDQQKEHFWMLTLNGRNTIQRMRLISMGCLTSSIVHPREAFRPAVMDAADAIIFGHNHPSGDPTPSDEDRRLTERLVEAGRILGITVLDHIIFAEGGFVSLMDHPQ